MGKFLISVLIGVIAGAICFALGMLLMPDSSDKNLRARKWHLQDAVITAFLVGLLTFCFL